MRSRSQNKSGAKPKKPQKPIKAKNLPGEAKAGDKRVRRSAKDARRLILDAAEKRLATQGPEGIRLQDIAADLGISHPSILHHFESREGLMHELMARTSVQLRDNLRQALVGLAERGEEAQGLVGSVFEALSDRGAARLQAWLVLTGRPQSDRETHGTLREIADKIHEQRVGDAKAKGVAPPDREDTMFMSLLVAVAAFGDAIIGRQLADDAGLDKTSAKRFRLWLAKLLTEHAG